MSNPVKAILLVRGSPLQTIFAWFYSSPSGWIPGFPGWHPALAAFHTPSSNPQHPHDAAAGPPKEGFLVHSLAGLGG